MMYDLAQLLANKPDYVGLTLSSVKIDDFQMALAAARDDMTSARLRRPCCRLRVAGSKSICRPIAQLELL